MIVLRLLCFLILSLGGCLLDLWTKSWVFQAMGIPGERDTHWLIQNVLGFQTSLNQGALWGMGQGQITLFVILSIFAILGIIVWIIFDTKKSYFLSLTLGWITAGIIGNLWDRLAWHGMVWSDFDVMTGQCTQNMVGTPIHAVRDWILVMIGSYHWPNFNLADSMLVTGTILIMIYSLLQKDEAKAVEN